MAGSYDLQIDQGATFDQGFQWTDGGGTPINLEGYIGACQIRGSATDSTVLATANVYVTDAANGKFRIALTSVQTAAMPTSTRACYDKIQYVYDVCFTTGVNKYRVINGYAMVSPQVTK